MPRPSTVMLPATEQHAAHWARNLGAGDASRSAVRDALMACYHTVVALEGHVALNPDTEPETSDSLKDAATSLLAAIETEYGITPE